MNHIVPALALVVSAALAPLAAHADACDDGAPANNQSSYAQPADDASEYAQPQYAQSEYAQPEYVQPQYAQSSVYVRRGFEPGERGAHRGWEGRREFNRGGREGGEFRGGREGGGFRGGHEFRGGGEGGGFRGGHGRGGWR